jgi:hypothetical protein
MDFWRTVVVLFRRWYITVPAFVLTLVVAGAAYSVVPVQYQSDGVLVLTTPLSGGTESTVPNQKQPIINPLMNFGNSLALTASLVIQALASSEAASSLGVTPGDTTTYAVDNGSTNPEELESGPFIFVHGIGPSAKAAQDMAQRVADLAAVILDERQTEVDAPPSTHIGIQVVVPPAAGRPLLSSPMRAAAAVGALAGLASLAAVYGFESLMTHRRRRREEKERAARHGYPRRTTTDTDSGFGATTMGVSGRRSTHLGRSVNGAAPQAMPTGAVGVLESPLDDGRADRADRSEPGPPTDER